MTETNDITTVTTKKAEPPTTAEIDALLALYNDADKNVDDAIAKRDIFGEQIEAMIAKHGFLPPRSKKSKRIQGDEWRATLSKSQSVDVDGTAVLSFLAYLKVLKLERWFSKFFKRESIFVLRDNAHQLLNSFIILATKTRTSEVAEALQLKFAKTMRIEGRSSSLKVEPLKEEKAA